MAGDSAAERDAATTTHAPEGDSAATTAAAEGEPATTTHATAGDAAVAGDAAETARAAVHEPATAAERDAATPAIPASPLETPPPDQGTPIHPAAAPEQTTQEPGENAVSDHPSPAVDRPAPEPRSDEPANEPAQAPDDHTDVATAPDQPAAELGLPSHAAAEPSDAASGGAAEPHRAAELGDEPGGEADAPDVPVSEPAEPDRDTDQPATHPDEVGRGGDDRDRTPRAPGGEPRLPDDIQYSDLDAEARRELRSLTKPTAELVGRHLVAAGRLIDEEPELALEHARFARSRAARVALVREAAGLAAYHAGHWAEALGELRAVRRMSGGQAHLPVMADCERALGRPERALELAAEAPPDLPKDIAIELAIVAAGARRDMGQLDAAVVALQGPDLDPRIREPWSARLFYAYADNLEAAGRADDAVRWFLNAAEADLDEDTDAAERAFALRDTE